MPHKINLIVRELERPRLVLGIKLVLGLKVRDGQERFRISESFGNFILK